MSQSPKSHSPLENSVAQHYQDSDLLTRILAGLEASNIDPDNVTIDDLAPVDEFHIGGRAATIHAVDKLSLGPEHHVLDVGCGIGGAARYIAHTHKCRLSGIDLTRDYIETAKALSQRAHLDQNIEFLTASALDMPFNDAAFDAGVTIHVAMNIEDRAALYSEISRVLKPGAKFCIYDVMRVSNEPITFPVPWAQSAATSHLTSVNEMRDLLDDAGFDVVEVDDRTKPAIEFFNRRLAEVAQAKGPPPPLGIHLILGASAGEKFKNTLANIKAGKISPIEIIVQRRA